MAEGRAERESVPLEAHGEWAASDGRPDPVGILEEQNATRVPELVPIRHGRMIVSPFTFYRGGAAIMASDLSQTPSTGLRVQCCGDAHLSNFGVFAAPDRRLVFDLNDFDETLPAPFEWDVKRLVASFVVAARDNGHRRKEQRAAARAAAEAYRTTMAMATAMRFLEVWYARIDAEDLLTELAAREDKATIKAAQKGLAKARKRTSLGSLSKFARAGRRWLPDQAAAAGDRAPARGDVRRLRADHPPGTHRLCALAVTRAASRARPLPLRGLRPQGRRRRLGRDRGVHGPADGRPRRRPAVPAGQGSGHVRARPVCGRRRIRAAGRAGGSGPARHAGRQRPVPRLGDRDRGARAGVLRPSAARHEGLSG